MSNDHIDFNKYAGQLDALPGRMIRAIESPTPVLYTTHHKVADGYEYLIRRLPNWWVMRALVAAGNRYLKRNESSWRLVIRYRDPVKGARYGRGGTLRCAQARRFQVYVKQQMKWVR